MKGLSDKLLNELYDEYLQTRFKAETLENQPDKWVVNRYRRGMYQSVEWYANSYFCASSFAMDCNQAFRKKADEYFNEIERRKEETITPLEKLQQYYTLGLYKVPVEQTIENVVKHISSLVNKELITQIEKNPQRVSWLVVIPLTSVKDIFPNLDQIINTLLLTKKDPSALYNVPVGFSVISEKYHLGILSVSLEGSRETIDNLPKQVTPCKGSDIDLSDIYLK